MSFDTVREISRALAAAYRGLQLHALVVYPVGGVMAFANVGEGLPASTRLVTLIAPFANIVAGALLLGFSYGIDPGVRLLDDPWISPSYVLRSLVWTQFVLGAVSLLPAAAVSMRKLIPKRTDAEPSATTRIISINIARLLALTFVVAGIAIHNVWLILFGSFNLLAAMLRTGAPLETLAGSMPVRDVLQTEFAVLSSSDTLRSALESSVNSKDEVFPVLRGDRLVGSITRDTLTSQLASDGDSYVQGSMTRMVALAFPDEGLAPVLRRAASAEIIVVVEDDSVIGVLTQQSVLRAAQRLSLLRSLRTEDAGS